jgi:hypothetical protein
MDLQEIIMEFTYVQSDTARNIQAYDKIFQHYISKPTVYTYINRNIPYRLLIHYLLISFTSLAL